MKVATGGVPTKKSTRGEAMTFKDAGCAAV
jgi:hypothetical protein